MLLSDGRVVSLAPQALAELTPQLAEGYYYPQSNGIQLERNFAYYNAIYRSQPWVRTIVDKVANAVARLTMNVWDVNSDDKQTRALDLTSPYARLIASPSNSLSSYDFWNWVSSTIEIYGETFLVKVRNDAGQVISLQPMHPSRVGIRRDPSTGEYVYIWLGGNSAIGLLEFAERDVVAFKLFNPVGTERGLSRLESLKSTLISEDSSRNATASMWKNAGMPNIVLTTTKKINTEGANRLKRQFDAIHAGSDNAGKTAVLEDGMDAKQLQLTAVEMQFVQARQLNREEVCGVYDVAPPIVQILDRATFSNITAQMRAFYRDTMAPRLEMIESVLDFQLGVEFNGSKRATFAVSDVLRGDYETRANAVAQLVQVGVMKPAEGRELMELGDAGPKADALYANSAIQPLGTPAERITLTGQVGHDPDGVALDVTQVPSPAGLPPIAVPKLPAAAPKPAALPAATVPEKQPAPRTNDGAVKHLRAVKGAIGRGIEIREFAMRLAEKHPDDLDDILTAVRIAINERNSHADH